jgi:hypothetical protein
LAFFSEGEREKQFTRLDGILPEFTDVGNCFTLGSHKHASERPGLSDFAVGDQEAQNRIS